MIDQLETRITQDVKETFESAPQHSQWEFEIIDIRIKNKMYSMSENSLVYTFELDLMAPTLHPQFDNSAENSTVETITLGCMVDSKQILRYLMEDFGKQAGYV